MTGTLSQVWSRRVRRIHNCYIILFPTMALVCLGLLVFSMVTIGQGGEFPKWTWTTVHYLHKLTWAMLLAQVVSARLVFFRCPLTILEKYLRGDVDVGSFWVVRLLSPGWTIALLVSVPPLLFGLFLAIDLACGLLLSIGK